MLTTILPILSALGTIGGMLGWGGDHTVATNVATSLASTVGVASMVAAQKMPNWLYNMKFVGKVYVLCVNALAFNFGAAKNDESAILPAPFAEDD